jgi:hypothetical protein
LAVFAFPEEKLEGECTERGRRGETNIKQGTPIFEINFDCSVFDYSLF